MRKYLLSAICLVLISFTVVSAEVKVGDKAKPIKVKKWVTKNKANLDVLAGKVYLIQFWTTWCPHCVEEIPHLNELSEKYAKHGLVVIGLSGDDDPYAVRNLLKKTEVKYSIAYDGKASSIYGINGYPTGVVIDSKGIVRWKGHTGNQSLEKEIKDALKETPEPILKGVDLSGFEKIKVPFVEGPGFAKVYKALKYCAASGTAEQQSRASEIIAGIDSRTEKLYLFAENLEKADVKTAMRLFISISKNYRGPEASVKASQKVRQLRAKLIKAKKRKVAG